jgi:DNA-binding response OmpR family regulator
MSKYNILIVEDELIPANYLKKILQKYGHNVVGIANSEQTAMAYINQDISIDLVLMDIKIQGEKDGIATAKMMQSSKSVAILFISAYADTDFLERAKDINTIGYLVKPIQSNTLLTTIEVGMSHIPNRDFNSSTLIPLCHKIVFDKENQLIKSEEKTINLSYRETIILETLISKREILISTEEIEAKLYEFDPHGEGALRTTIWRLRKKLPSCVIIENVYKSGYKIRF